jgi:transcriptional regulator with XRE-family HTH domain
MLCKKESFAVISKDLTKIGRNLQSKSYILIKNILKNYCFSIHHPTTKKNFIIMNLIGQRIKKLREERNITQEAMAKHLDVTQSNYGRLEKDDRRLNVVKLLKIVHILDVNIMTLFGDTTHGGMVANGENFAPGNKEVYDILVESLRSEVQHLKDEISFLRVIVRS